MSHWATPLDSLFQDHQPKAGNYIHTDEWPHAGKLIEADAFDHEYFGGENLFRVQTGRETIQTLPVQVEVTGSVAHWNGHFYKVRVKITFRNDGEPDVTVRGWMWLD